MKKAIKKIWKYNKHVNRLLSSGHRWIIFRLPLLVFVIILILIVLYLSSEKSAAISLAGKWIAKYSILANIPLKIMQFLAFYLSRLGLRYLSALVIALIGGLLVAAHFLQDIYELNIYQIGLRYLITSIFGIGFQRLIITDGKSEIKHEDINLLDIIGGPGLVQIRPGNAVIFERLKEPADVNFKGVYFMNRFEKVKEIIDLKDQEDTIDQIESMTKDGIKVNIRHVKIRYRLKVNPMFGLFDPKKLENPYPYSIDSVRKLTYNRVVGIDGKMSWGHAVRIVLSRKINEYMSAHNIDQITAPEGLGIDPRGDISKILNSKIVRDELLRIGTELIWFDLGYIEIDNDAVAQ